MSKKKPQHIQKIVLNVTAPIKMDSEIELSRIAVFVGQNDSGKSLILKIAYALAAIGCSEGNPVKVPLKEGAQFIFDNVFTDQNFNGSLKAIYTEGSVSVDLHEGTVVNVEITDLVNPAPMIFMSTDMRTFDQMCLYLRMRIQAGADPVIFMKTMLGAYRLYDLTYMESLIARCPIRIPDPLRATLKSFDFKESITSLEVDLDKCEFHAVLEDGSKKNVATYGKGHQAVLNMFLGIGA
jgi:hypothetical protein